MSGNTIVRLFLIFSTATSCSYAYYIDNCANGPEYWCKSWETAIECGTIEYCKSEGLNNNVRPPTEPVRIGLYYESLCSDCQEFIANQLYPTYQTLLSTGILAIDLYPFGNAEERREGNLWTFTCQHGNDECTINTIETCALHLLSPSMKIPFVQCIEKNPTVITGQTCAKNLSVNWQSISACSTGLQGNYLEHVMALETNILDPPHSFVPWITINGTHTKDIQDKATSGLLKLVCDTYTGYKPKECTDLEFGYIKKTSGKCYRDKLMKKGE